MSKIDQRNYFVHPALDIAKDLLGKIICRKADNGIVKRWRIVETEAYSGDCPYVYTETPFYTVGEWVAHDDMLMITCFSKESPDNVMIRGIDGYIGTKAVVEALGVVSGEIYLRDTLWLEDDGNMFEYVTGERSFLPDGDMVNFRVKL